MLPSRHAYLFFNQLIQDLVFLFITKVANIINDMYLNYLEKVLQNISILESISTVLDILMQ